MLAQTSTNLLTNLTTAHQPCGNLNLTGPGIGQCHDPKGADGNIQCPDQMVRPDTPGEMLPCQPQFAIAP